MLALCLRAEESHSGWYRSGEQGPHAWYKVKPEETETKEQEALAA